MTDNLRAARGLAPDPSLYDQADSTNTCLLCGNPRFELHMESDHYGFPLHFYRCACGLIKQAPMPSPAFFQWFFNSEQFFAASERTNEHIWGYYDYFADEPSRMATSRYRYWRLRRFFEEEGRPLDVMKIGPATGTFLAVAKEHGHRVRGCDISSRFASYAKEHYGVDIDNGQFEEMGYPDEAFDVVLLLNVIENLPDPLRVLSEIRRTLKPNGRFIFNYVAMEHNLVAAMQKERYSLYRPPVTYVFTTDTMRQLLAKAGLRFVRSYRDVRVMHLEKIMTLGGWRGPLRLARALRVHRIPFFVYAYPSRIAIAERVQA